MFNNWNLQKPVVLVALDIGFIKEKKTSSIPLPSSLRLQHSFSSSFCRFPPKITHTHTLTYTHTHTHTQTQTHTHTHTLVIFFSFEEGKKVGGGEEL